MEPWDTDQFRCMGSRGILGNKLWRSRVRQRQCRDCGRKGQDRVWKGVAVSRHGRRISFVSRPRRTYCPYPRSCYRRRMLATAVAPIRAKRPLINLGMEIRALSSADTEAFRAIRRESLENAPRAFAESLAEHDSLSPQQFAKRLASSTSLTTISSSEHFEETKRFDRGMIRPHAPARRRSRIRPQPAAEAAPQRLDLGSLRAARVSRHWRRARDPLAELIRRAKTLDGLEQINLNVATGTAAAPPSTSRWDSRSSATSAIRSRSMANIVDEDLMVLFLKKATDYSVPCVKTSPDLKTSECGQTHGSVPFLGRYFNKLKRAFMASRFWLRTCCRISGSGAEERRNRSPTREERRR